MIKTPSVHSYQGIGSIKHRDKEYNSSFNIFCCGAKAYIEFNEIINENQPFGIMTFYGKTDEGLLIEGSIDVGNFSVSDNFRASLELLKIGTYCDDRMISEISTFLLGMYYPFTIEFTFEGYNISIIKSSNTSNDAKVAKAASGTILEGNEIIVKGENLEVLEIKKLLIDLCFLLRPIYSGEIYFSRLLCNGKLLIYDNNYCLKGRTFGNHCNTIESTTFFRDLLTNGLQNYRKLSEAKRKIYNSIGYALATSHGCGIMENAISSLTQSLEFAGHELSNEFNLEQDGIFRNNVKDIKKHLAIEFENYVEKASIPFDEKTISGFKSSINRIQPWNPEVIKKIKLLLSHYNLNIEFDFDEFKEVRDSLAHSGYLPKDFPIARRYDIKMQYELILFLVAMDCIEIETLVKTRGDQGWLNYKKNSEFKKN